MTDATTPPLNQRQIAKAKTQERIRTVATALFAEVGYEKATVRAIAKKAGMSTGAVFANWADKESLWTELMGCPAPRDGAVYRAAPHLILAVTEAANQFRFYERQHRAKKTPEAEAKAEVNRELAERFEALVVKATTPLPFEVADAG